MVNAKKSKTMLVLGLETSCDETGIALYEESRGLLAHELYSQTEIHSIYGGVVPELASRDHIRKILPLLEKTLQKANVKKTEIQGVAYTAGPGLMGALLVGALLGRSLAFSLKIPSIGVHHLEAHILAAMLEEERPSFPFLALLVSGGHTLLIKVEELGQYKILGDTLDDAVGEAFDKTANLLGLNYPGGAELAKLAEKGQPDRFQFPRPLLEKTSLDFSFSGLKTFASRIISQNTLDEQTKADIAKGFETAIVETLVTKCYRALQFTQMKSLVLAGGVGANLSLRRALISMADQEKAKVYFPRLEFCTDNGAMVAYTGCQRLLRGQQDGLSVEAKPRWSLEDLSPFKDLK